MQLNKLFIFLSMDFSSYKNFRELLDKDYGVYYERYPNAFLILDFIAQMRTYESLFPGSKYKDNDLYFSMYIDSLIDSKFFSFIYSFYISVFSYFFKFRTKKFTIHNSIPEQKFNGLTGIIQSIAKENNWRIIEQGNVLQEKIDYLLFKKISPYRCFVGLRTKRFIKKFRLVDKETWFNLLNNEDLMLGLDKSVVDDVRRTSRIVKNLGIDLFVNTGDSSGQARILIESSKSNGSKTITFAHGYFKEDTLIGVAPVRSDKLILWTEKQKEDLLRAVGEKEIGKLSNIGFPKDLSAKKKNNNNITSLLLMGYIFNIIRSEKTYHTFQEIIKSIREISEKVIIRLHPNERDENKIIEELTKLPEIEISDSELSTDIARADYIFGANTSALIEAASTGEQVFLLEELLFSGIDYEGTISIKHNKIKAIEGLKGRIQANKDIVFNRDKLKENLRNLIYKLFSNSLDNHSI